MKLHVWGEPEPPIQKVYLQLKQAANSDAVDLVACAPSGRVTQLILRIKPDGTLYRYMLDNEFVDGHGFQVDDDDRIKLA